MSRSLLLALYVFLLAALSHSSRAPAGRSDCTLLPPPWSHPPKLSVAAETINLSSTRMPSPRNTQICGLYEGMTVRTRFPFGFSVTLMDERGQPVQRGGWDVMVNMTDFGDTYFGHYFDLMNGTFFYYSMPWLSDSLPSHGSVSVRLNKSHLPGSPFTVRFDAALDIQRRNSMVARTSYQSPCSSFAIATGASSDMMDRLENFIGSVHFWAPGVPVLAYDLGLVKEDVFDIGLWQGVQLRKFDDDLPPHCLRVGENITSYAFKALALTDALHDYECALWLDAGFELRNNITAIVDSITSLGYFFTTNGWPFPNQYTHPLALQYFGLSYDDFSDAADPSWVGVGPAQELEACGGAQGYRRGSEAFNEVLGPITACAVVEDCIAPPGTDRDNHRQDQVALNIVLHRKENRGHFWVEPSRIYWRTAPDAENLLPEDPTEPSLNSTLYVRRGFQPKNYAQFLNERPDTRYPGMIDDM